MTYNWQQKDWPNFRFETSVLADELSAFREAHAGVLPAYQLIAGSSLETEGLTLEALRTSSVEGERVDEGAILSSVCRVMGVKPSCPAVHADARSEGVASLVMSVRRDWNRPLTRELLLFWHRDLRLGLPGAGEFRTHAEAMQIVRRDAYGDYEVRFVAPPSSRVESEISRFLEWEAAFLPSADVAARAALKSALFHLYFESIHPFEDGNGRIGRALVAKWLAESFGAPVIVPVSAAIEKHRTAYYDELQAASRILDWTRWTKFFIPILTEAMDSFARNVRFILRKRDYLATWEQRLTERQLKVIRRLFKDGEDGIARGLSAAKYQRMTGVSKPTATRDLAALVACGAVRPVGAGRAASYQLAF